MATPPLPPAIIDRITARTQSVRWSAILKEVRYFAAFICAIDADVIMGVPASPVLFIDVSPNPVCLGSAIAWDLSASFAPGSTVASYTIDFGDTNDDTGASGNHTYGAAGSYTITATITSAAGKVQIQFEEVNVIDCSDPLLLDTIYASTDGSGVYYWE